MTPVLLILGGGPAGCAAAVAARRHGLGPVLVVEASDYQADRVGESVPPDIRVLLDALGLRAAFDRQGHEPCHGSCSAWGDDALGYNDFVFNPNGSGVHLDRRRFDRFMAEAAIAAGATLLTRARFRAARRQGGGFVVELETSAGRRLVPARFVIDASGSRATFARTRGAERLIHDRMFCATGYFHLHERAELSHLTMLEAVPEGWWYAARLPDRRVAVAFACDADVLRTKGLQHERAWLEQLAATRHLAPALADCFSLANSLAVCPISCFVLDRPVGDGWLAVGDAASAFDPLSARGIHKALAGALAAVDSLVAARDGDVDALEHYATNIHAGFRAYLGQRDELYRRERRWPEAEFWRRRLMPASDARLADLGRDRLTPAPLQSRVTAG